MNVNKKHWCCWSSPSKTTQKLNLSLGIIGFFVWERQPTKGLILHYEVIIVRNDRSVDYRFTSMDGVPYTSYLVCCWYDDRPEKRQRSGVRVQGRSSNSCACWPSSTSRTRHALSQHDGHGEDVYSCCALNIHIY